MEPQRLRPLEPRLLVEVCYDDGFVCIENELVERWCARLGGRASDPFLPPSETRFVHERCSVRSELQHFAEPHRKTLPGNGGCSANQAVDVRARQRLLP